MIGGSSPSSAANAEWPSSRRRPPAKRSGDSPARVRIPSRRPSRGCSSRAERRVADAPMPVRVRPSTPISIDLRAKCWWLHTWFPPRMSGSDSRRPLFLLSRVALWGRASGTVAQLEERRPETPEVISSTLVGPTFHRAQSTRSSPAEHRSDTPEAPGAAPGASTTRRGPAGHGARLIRERHLVRFQGGGPSPVSAAQHRPDHQRRYAVMETERAFTPRISVRPGVPAPRRGPAAQRRVAHQQSASPTPRRQSGRHRPRRLTQQSTAGCAAPS